jgi:hypothetical protein
MTIPQFVYVGDQDETVVFGVKFTRGEPTTVEMTNEKEQAHVVAKLRGNADFTESIDGAEVMVERKKPGRKPRVTE